MTRLNKLASLLKREVSDILLRKIDDSKIGFISITHVEVARNLGFARVFYSQIGSEGEKKTTFNQLKKRAPYIQGELGKVLHLRTVPKLFFLFDESIERGVKTLNKLNNLE